MVANNLLTNNLKAEVFFKILSRPYHLEITEQQPYVCILFVADKDVNQKEQNYICKKVIDSNCKYVVCAGNDCSHWEDAMDMTILEKWDFEVPDHEHVMTSSHKDDVVAEVVNWGLISTNFDDHTFQKYLILQIGKNDELSDQIIKSVAEIR